MVLENIMLKKKKENIMLSKTGQIKKNKCCMISLFVESRKTSKNEFIDTKNTFLVAKDNKMWWANRSRGSKDTNLQL